ncbi:hypothetical protein HQ585_01930 [candidate division KSB1 bacterium]|nr:hypothetical protein [candidate division KSB1 bacterium]
MSYNVDAQGIETRKDSAKSSDSIELKNPKNRGCFNSLAAFGSVLFLQLRQLTHNMKSE